MFFMLHQVCFFLTKLQWFMMHRYFVVRKPTKKQAKSEKSWIVYLTLFNFAIYLIWKSFYSCKFVCLEAYISRCFLPWWWSARPTVHFYSVPVCFLWVFCHQFCVQQLKCMPNWIPVGWLTGLLQNISVLCLEEVWGFFEVCFMWLFNAV